MNNIYQKRVSQILKHAEKHKICVIGDVMLDEYFYGEVHRISPEAPVPVIEVTHKETSLGGAANVALNIKTLGAEPFIYGSIGTKNWENAQKLVQILNKFKIQNKLYHKDGLTTTKTRVISGSHNIVRIDQEDKIELNHKEKNEFLAHFKRNIKKFSAVILQDYNKGFLTEGIVKALIEISNENQVPVLVDPKEENFFEYKNVSWFKPNRKETIKAMGIDVNSLESDELEILMSKMSEMLQCENILITRSELGVAYYSNDKNSCILEIMEPTCEKIVNVSGAGDTVIATLATMLAGKANKEEAVLIANLAAGIVCSKMGITPIESKELIDALK